MGLFDIFKETPTTLGTFHGMDIREWTDGYKTDEKAIIKFIKTSEYNNSIAIRPKNSSLNIDKICNTFNVKKRNWKIQLKKTISKIYKDNI